MGGKSKTSVGRMYDAHIGALSSRNQSQQTIKTRFSQPVTALPYNGISLLSGSFDTTEAKKRAKKAKIQPVSQVQSNPLFMVGESKLQSLTRSVEAVESKRPTYGKTDGIRQYIR